MADEPLAASTRTGQPGVLAVHCSEPGVREVFAEVLEKQHPGRIIEAVSVPGGPWWVARAASATRSKTRRWLAGRVAEPIESAVRSALGLPSLQAIELVGHEGCTWYTRTARGATPGELVRRQGEDLYLAAEELARWSRLPVAGRIVLARAEGGAVVRTLFG
ncbi:MAG: hypothetical protein R3B97_02530 [Dehalococcoidia bacterium]|nr:hypothetical protein [Dehalococcoidia bacterium]MCB9485183.1 hypothetical protein [Thermoflexaceae bacterium]